MAKQSPIESSPGTDTAGSPRRAVHQQAERQGAARALSAAAHNNRAHTSISKSKTPSRRGGNCATKSRPTTNSYMDMASASSSEMQAPVRRSRRGDNAISQHPQVGSYRTELTSSRNMWCGKFSLEISTAQQLGADLCLTLADFDAAFLSAECRALTAKIGLAERGIPNDRNFDDEQLNCVLALWGRARGLKLQLGVIREYEGVFVNPPYQAEGAEEEEGEFTTVWIHNDNASMRGCPSNHYSGVSVL